MTKQTHSTPLFVLSAASSLCFCSIACLNFVASLYSFFNSLLVTGSHSFLLSVGDWLSKALTVLGTGWRVATSISVAHSSSAPIVRSERELAADWAGEFVSDANVDPFASL